MKAELCHSTGLVGVKSGTDCRVRLERKVRVSIQNEGETPSIKGAAGPPVEMKTSRSQFHQSEKVFVSDGPTQQEKAPARLARSRLMFIRGWSCFLLLQATDLFRSSFLKCLVSFPTSKAEPFTTEFRAVLRSPLPLLAFRRPPTPSPSTITFVPPPH